MLARRWRVPEGELDLVCLDPGRFLVAIEVRLGGQNAVAVGSKASTAGAWVVSAWRCIAMRRV